MKGCLDGIRVLELGNFISGPYGAMLLADLGAEVIKVENPKGGDPFRGWDFGGDQPNFWAYNRGKKSVTLNLQTPEGKEVFYGLVKKSDVVMDNYRPGVTKKLGIDFESLRQINEKIVCCSITGTGPTGPYTRPRQSQTYAFACADGAMLAIHLSSPQKFWEGLCKSVDHPELIEDPRFNTRPNRRTNYDELNKTFAVFFKEQPRSVWIEKLEANDVPHTPVYNLKEVFDDPQVQHMGMQIAIERKDKPTIRTVKFPISYSETPSDHPAPPPELGENNAEFLTALGYDEKKIAEFKEKGIL